MAKKKEIDARGDQRLENIEETLTKTEQFIVNNQTVLSIVIGAIIVIILGYFGYQKYIVEPKAMEAQEQMFVAQRFFESDSLDKALYGDGNSLGFLDIIDEYGSTRPGNLANYYAGMSFLKKGDFEQAISYLEEFSTDTKIIGPLATGAIGDAYLELGEYSDAASYYIQAANQSENDFSTPLFLLKAGQVYELMEEYDKALDSYTRIKEKYSKSNEARTIDKNIGRATALKERS
jgi:tetratricopeptide (TPR) repeat protein